MVEFEEKFFVVNLKHLKDIPPFVRPILNEAARHTKKNKYYVCNRDEPYADEVLRIILEGERIKFFILDESDIEGF